MTLRPSVTLIFEGATDDAFETTLTVADPTEQIEQLLYLTFLVL